MRKLLSSRWPKLDMSGVSIKQARSLQGGHNDMTTDIPIKNMALMYTAAKDNYNNNIIIVAQKYTHTRGGSRNVKGGGVKVVFDMRCKVST